MFTQAWFLDLSQKYPLLKQFITQKIQTSSDEAKQVDDFANLTVWHQALYQFLRWNLQLPERERFAELERTLLSISFVWSMLPEFYQTQGKEFIRQYGSNLNEADIEKIKNLAEQAGVKLDPAEASFKDFILSVIFADIGKIDKVRRDYAEYGLSSQDQDIALDFILNLGGETLAQYFSLTTQQVQHLKVTCFPLHLGHAAQAECTARKFVETQEMLSKLTSNQEKRRLIAYAIFKQIVDVAGARAQNGAIANKDPAMIEGIASNSTEFAILVGLKIEALAARQYLIQAKVRSQLLQSPLSFNKLNVELQKDPQLALRLYRGEAKLIVSDSGEPSVNTQPAVAPLIGRLGINRTISANGKEAASSSASREQLQPG